VQRGGRRTGPQRTVSLVSPGVLPSEVQFILLTLAFCLRKTGLPLSTYFSAIKLRWVIDNWEHFRKAHEADDLAFGTIESWIPYVGLQPYLLSRALVDRLGQNSFGGLSASQHLSEVANASQMLLLSVRTLDERGVRKCRLWAFQGCATRRPHWRPAKSAH
jgi:hypothetical protein